MFVTLELQQPNRRGLLKYASALLPRPRPEVAERDAFGVRYALIRAQLRGGEPDWQAVEAAAGRYAGRMLFPDDVSPPPGSGMRAVSCPRFELRVLCDTACELVKRTRMPMYRRVLGLFDPQAEYSELLYPLLHHYTTIRVVTADPRLYDDAADRMLEQLGAPVLLGTDSSAFADCVLVLAPGTPAAPLKLRPPCPVLSTAPLPLPGGDNFYAPEAVVQPEIAALCPPGTSPRHFAAALHDYCEVDVGSYTADRLSHSGRLCTLEESAGLLLRNLRPVYT